MVEISVIMGAYNAEKYISECIQSTLDQSFKDIEVIVVNDGSTDNTAKTIKRFHDERLILLDNGSNLGVAKALNNGLRHAQGKYIAIMDSDDVMMPDRLKITHDYLEKHKDVFLVAGGLEIIDYKGKKSAIDIPLLGFNNIKERMKIRNCMWHNTVLFRNDKKTFYREKFKYAQDYDIYTLMITRGKRIENIPEILAKYRINPTSTSASRKVKQMMFVNKVAELYKERLKIGKDDYDNFDPNTILDMDTENSKDKDILLMEMNAHWYAKDFKGARKYAKKYLKLNGYANKMLLYYLLSYMPSFMLSMMRSVNRTLK